MELTRDESKNLSYAVDMQKNERIGLHDIHQPGADAPDVSARERFLQKYFSVRVCDLLNTVGADQAYQKKVLVILALFNFFYAFVGFMIPYVFYMPEFWCFDVKGNKFQCTESFACTNPHGYVTDSDTTSVVTEFALFCNRKGLRILNQGLFVVLGGALAFVGNIVSDRIGRYPIFIASYICSVVGILISLISDNLFGITIGNILSFTGMDTFLAMQVLYINELIGGGMRSKSVGLIFFFWGVGGIVINAANSVISHYKINYILQLVPLALLGFGYLYFTESPYLLYKRKRIKKLYQTLVFIGTENQRPLEALEETLNVELGLNYIVRHDINELAHIKIKRKASSGIQKMKSSFRFAVKILRSRSVVSRLLGVLIVAGNIFMGYALSLLIPQRLGLQNIYLNGIFLGIAEIIGNLAIAPFANRVRRKSLNFYCATGEFLTCFTLLLLELSDPSRGLKLVQTLLSCLVKIFVCVNFALIYNYCSELFPTKIRGFALGVCIIVGRTTGLLSLVLEDFTDSLGIHPMIGLIFSSVPALVVSLFLPETVNKAISN